MRKTINIIALIVFVLLVLDALSVPQAFLYFIIMGDLPGTSISLPPTTMLALITTLLGIMIFEFCARRIQIIWRVRQQLIHMLTRRERLPTRRFTRV